MRPDTPPPPDGDLRFPYHAAVAPMMWMLVAIGTVELAVTHVLLSFWSRPVAIGLSLVTLGGLAWIVRVIVSMRNRPVLLGADRLVMQVGTMRSVSVPLAQVAGLRPAWNAAAVKHRSVLNLALLAYPNVVVDLVAPLPGRRGVVAIAHRLDDPAAFAAALERLGARE